MGTLRIRTGRIRAARAPRIARAIGLVVVCATFTAGCGTRLPYQEIVAGAGGGTVRLPPESIAALRQAAEAGAAQSNARSPAAATPRLAAPVPATPGSRAAPRSSPDRPRPTAASTPAPVPAAASTPTSASVPAAGPADAPTCAHPLDPVAIGQVGFFSGFASPITGSIRTMLAVWVKDINARGGLACHPVVLYSQDDGGDASRSAAAVQQLVAVRHVVALVANAPLAVAGFRYAVEAAKVPAIGGGDSKDWFDSPWLFPQGASLEDQVVGVIRNGVAAGHKRLGVLYCVEATQCTEAIMAVRNHAAKAAGAELVYDAAVSIAQPDYTAQCLNARDAHVDQLALGLDGASILRVARSCAAIGYRPLFSTSNGVLSPGQATDETLRSFGVATASGQAPFTQLDTPGLRSYREAIARYAPNQAPDGASIVGWTCAKLLEAAVARVAEAAQAGPITSALLMKGLGQIRNESLGGLTAPISFSPGQRHATSSGCVFYEFLSTAGWSAPRGSRPVCVGP